MSRPTYNPIPDADVDLDSFGKETDVFQYLRDNAAAGRVQLIWQDVAEQTTTSASYVTLWSFAMHIPSAAADSLVTAEITGWLEARVSANDGDFRLQDNASATNGTAVNVTGTSYAAIEPMLAIADSWRGTVRTINVQARQNTSGTAYGRAETSAAARFDY